MASVPKREAVEGEIAGGGKNSAAAGSGGGRKVYPCSVCFREFSRIKAMHGHMRVHRRGGRGSREGRDQEEHAEVGRSEERSPSLLLRPLTGEWLAIGQPGSKKRSASPATGEGSDGIEEPAVKKPRAETAAPMAVEEAIGEVRFDETETPPAVKTPGGEATLLAPVKKCDRAVATPLLAVKEATGEVGSDETETSQAIDKPRGEAAPSAPGKKRHRAVATQVTAVKEATDEVDCDETETPLIFKKPRAETTPPAPVKKWHQAVATPSLGMKAATGEVRFDESETPPAFMEPQVEGMPLPAVKETTGREAMSWIPNVLYCARNLMYLQEHQAARCESVSSSLAPRTFPCAYCGRSFTSHQGLGGHMTIHRKDKDAAAAGEAGTSNTQRRAGRYICELCGEELPTGQSLGGHKRRHYNRALYGKVRSPLTGDDGGSRHRGNGQEEQKVTIAAFNMKELGAQTGGHGGGGTMAATAQNQLVVYVAPLDGRACSTPTGGGGRDTAVAGPRQRELYVRPPSEESSSAAVAAAPVRAAGVRSFRLFGFDVTVGL